LSLENNMIMSYAGLNVCTDQDPKKSFRIYNTNAYKNGALQGERGVISFSELRV
jgi:hypothetical protein